MLLLVGISTFTFILLITMSYFIYMETGSIIDGINYETTDTAASNGKISCELYENLERSIIRFGRYSIAMKLEKMIRPGVYDTYYNNSDIVDKGLAAGDRLTIRIETVEESAFGRIMRALPAYLVSTDMRPVIKTVSIKTAVVSFVSEIIAGGYEVEASIADLALHAGETGTNEELPAVHVITLLNKEGKYYGLPAAIAYPVQDNLFYGDEPDETWPSGINRIADCGFYVVETEYYPSGRLKLLRYIQQ